MLTRQKELSDLICCSYHSWYEDFRKNCIKSIVLPIPRDVLNYLKQDLFVLPVECTPAGGSSSSSDYVGEKTDFDDDDTEDAGAPEFREFSKVISETIEKLGEFIRRFRDFRNFYSTSRIPGGSAFIKTNWHSPKDSIWITAGQTLRVNDLTDVYQLLKASTICKEDLKEVEQEDFYHLVIKKWKDIHPGTEFRCFVKNRNLIAISPRDWPAYHEHFKTQRQDIIKDIVSLFKEKIKDRFPIDNCKR